MSTNPKNWCNVPSQRNSSPMLRRLDHIHTRFQKFLISDEYFRIINQDETNSEKEQPTFADPNETFRSSMFPKEHTRGINPQPKSGRPINSNFTIATSPKLVNGIQSKVIDSSVIKSQSETLASRVREFPECKFNPEKLSPASREQYYKMLQSN